jgi:5-methylcytosine-specific restriction protein A
LTGEAALPFAVNTITPAQIQAAYALARDVYDKKVEERAAVQSLERQGMNPASASDYIRNLSQMLDGKPYHRTLNDAGTSYYLQEVLADYGPAAATNALAALRGHIVYYEGIRGSRRPSLRKIAAEFQEALSRCIAVDEQALFQAEVQASEALPDDRRKAASRAFPKKPRTRIISVVAYDRNPHVVRSVLKRAAGVCEDCGQPAPFNRISTGKPYLEVHHKIRLADGGDDSVENALAVCPNCHRRSHYGA